MGGIFNQVGQAFVQAVPTVIFVTLLAILLKRLFFKPLGAVLRARRDQTQGALVRARERASLAEAKTAEYEAAWRAARQEIYSSLDAARREALTRRDEIIRQARQQAEAAVRQAQDALSESVEGARAGLVETSASLADQIAEAVLSDQPPDSDAGGVRV